MKPVEYKGFLATFKDMASDESPPNSPPAPPKMTAPKSLTSTAAQFLIDRINYERTSDIPYGKREFKLDRMRRLLDRLGNPQKRLRIVHVAGSKGKGSTSTMIASILASAGLRTGLFTSPHLLRLEERFQVDGEEIAAEELSAIIQTRIQPIVAQLDQEATNASQPWDTPTFFEIVTAVAMLHFERQKVDAAVLEVGLGGRLDSTNVCDPECCVITSISLDHTKQLGATHAEIASEKAGILKSQVPLVTGVMHPEALETISTIAKERDCAQWTINRDFDFKLAKTDSKTNLDAPPEIDFSIHSPSHGDRNQQPTSQTLKAIQVGMWGEHQAANAAVAIMTASVLMTKDHLIEDGWRITERAIRKGILNAKCTARIEVVSEDPTVVVDTAHNVASTWALTATLDQRFPLALKNRIVIFATSRGKEYRKMLDLLIPWAKHVILTKYQNNPRGVPIEQLKNVVNPDEETLTAADPAEALQLATELAEDDSLICVTGSFFLAAEIIEIVGRK